MSGKRSRTKGHSYEREVAKELRDLTGIGGIRRGLQYRDGAEAPDVVCPGFHIEAKRMKRTNPRAALAQAIADSAGNTDIPVAVCRDDGAEAFVVMRWADWVQLAREEIVRCSDG